MPNNIRINDKNGAKEILTAKERLNREYSNTQIIDQSGTTELVNAKKRLNTK